MCTHHPLVLSRSAHDISPVIVHAAEILIWNGPRPAPAWQLLHAVPELKRAKKTKKGTWTVTGPCECEVCKVFYPVFARSSRHYAAHSQMLQIWSGMLIHEFCAKFARICMNSYTMTLVILSCNATPCHPIFVRPGTPTSDSTRSGTLLLLHSRAT